MISTLYTSQNLRAILEIKNELIVDIFLHIIFKVTENYLAFLSI